MKSIKTLGRIGGHGFAQQEIAVGHLLGEVVEKGLVEHHHPIGSGLLSDGIDQRQAGQRLADNAVGEVAVDMLNQTLGIVVEAL